MTVIGKTPEGYDIIRLEHNDKLPEDGWSYGISSGMIKTLTGVRGHYNTGSKRKAGYSWGFEVYFVADSKRNEWGDIAP